MRTPRPQSAEPWVDPAEDAASMAGLSLAPAIAREAAQVRAAHMARRMAETDDATKAKVAKWRQGGTPQGGRHR